MVMLIQGSFSVMVVVLSYNRTKEEECALINEIEAAGKTLRP